jgi:hypothetical protein
VKKAIVAEIGKSTLVLNAFGDINTTTPKRLGQVVVRSGLKNAIALLERDIGPLDEEQTEIYIVSSLKEPTSVQEIVHHEKPADKRQDLNSSGELNVVEHKGGLNIDNFKIGNKILATDQAITNLSSLFLQQVGDVLILDVGGGSTDIYLFQRNQPLRLSQGLGIYQDAKTIVKEIGEQDIKSRYGSDWLTLVKPIPETAEEIALGRELAAYALEKTIRNFCRSDSQRTQLGNPVIDLTQLRWVIGTGGAFSHLPGGVEMIREACNHCLELAFPEEGFPVLIDQDNILASLGPFSNRYADAGWQLLLESLGVDS